MPFPNSGAAIPLNVPTSAIEAELARLGYNNASGMASVLPVQSNPANADTEQTAIAKMLAARGANLPVAGNDPGTAPPSEFAPAPPTTTDATNTNTGGGISPWWLLGIPAVAALMYRKKEHARNPNADPAEGAAIDDEIRKATAAAGVDPAEVEGELAKFTPIEGEQLAISGPRVNDTLEQTAVQQALAGRTPSAGALPAPADAPIRMQDATQGPVINAEGRPDVPRLQGPGTIPESPTEAELARRTRERRSRQEGAKPTESRDPMVQLKDQYPDLTDDELTWARRKAAELLEQQGRGTREVAEWEKTHRKDFEDRKPFTPGRPQVPTARGGRVDQITEDDMMGAVVRMIRLGKEAGKNKGLLKLRGGNKGSQLRKIL